MVDYQHVKGTSEDERHDDRAGIDDTGKLHKAT
jgi:hypothetical protein